MDDGTNGRRSGTTAPRTRIRLRPCRCGGREGDRWRESGGEEMGEEWRRHQKGHSTMGPLALLGQIAGERAG